MHVLWARDSPSWIEESRIDGEGSRSKSSHAVNVCSTELTCIRPTTFAITTIMTIACN